jgi:lambda family phage minor tail protein L
MDTPAAKVSTKKIATAASALEPSAIVSLYEIDISDLVARSERKVNTTLGDPIRNSLRFHNNLKLIQTSIIWNGNTYYPAPIQTSGFETTAKGTPPAPRLTMTINPDGLDEETKDRIKYIKYAIRDLDSMTGAKVTRTRTFVRYIDGANFYDNYGTATQKLKSNTLPPPEGFDPDPNAYFPQDIYFIDRKSGENKSTIELELASPFDLQNLKLPGRIVTEQTCIWAYRGEGCCYEYTATKKTDYGEVHYNQDNGCKVPHGGIAPPVATFKNEKLSDVIGTSLKHSPHSNVGGTYTPGALWDKDISYQTGQYVRVELKGVSYYFVSRLGSGTDLKNTDRPPPNGTYWVADECSKELWGCSLRWVKNPEIPDLTPSALPIGAFPTSRRGGTS